VNIQLPANWEPRTYQLPVWRYFEGSGDRKRGVCVWHRRAGKDLLAINLIACKAFQRVGTYWHVFPEFKQARAAIWNGITSEGKSYMDAFPKELIRSKHENEMRIDFINGSRYYLVGSDNYDGLMGTNPVGVVVSEYSIQDPMAWQHISPILVENKGFALFIYTFRGRNHGWWLAQQAKKNGWFYDERMAGSGEFGTKRTDGTPVMSDESIQKERDAGIPEAVIQQEYFNNCDAPLEGAFYEKQMQRMLTDGRICNVPWDSKLPVYTAWDIGVNDLTVIIFYQLYRKEIRIIDLYHNNDEGLPHYVKIIKEKPYSYDVHHFPWDVDTREFQSGKSTLDILKGLGIKVKVTPQKPGNASILDGIEQVRSLLERCWIDKEKCIMLLEALRSYRKEPDSDKMQFTGDSTKLPKVFKDKALHDWSSHFCDPFRVLAWNYRDKANVDWDRLQEKAMDTYTYV
jgi:hypothetical protein